MIGDESRLPLFCDHVNGAILTRNMLSWVQASGEDTL